MEKLPLDENIGQGNQRTEIFTRGANCEPYFHTPLYDALNHTLHYFLKADDCHQPLTSWWPMSPRFSQISLILKKRTSNLNSPDFSYSNFSSEIKIFCSEMIIFYRLFRWFLLISWHFQFGSVQWRTTLVFFCTVLILLRFGIKDSGD